MNDPPAPPIPFALAHLPVVAGLAVPWITPRTGDGRYLFGVLDADRQRACLTHRRCQICGNTLGRTVVLLARESDLPRRCTAEPPAHPWCAAYTARACPMVAGRMTHYRATARDLHSLTDAAPDVPARLGAPAEPWFAVWIRDYTVITDPATGTLAASYVHTTPLRIRPINPRPQTPATAEAPPNEQVAGDRSESGAEPAEPGGANAGPQCRRGIQQ